MTIYVVITLALIFGKVFFMVKGKVPSDIIGLGIISILLVTETLTTDQTLSCFSSQSVVLVGVLMVLVAGMIHSGVLQWIVKHVLGSPSGTTSAIFRLFLPTTIMSGVMNNLAVVAMFIPVVKIWAKRFSIPISKMLIPLSYASTLGGMCTLIGNTHNLVIADLYQDVTGNQLSIFTPLLPGLFCAVIGLIVIVVMQGFIPVRKSPEESFAQSADYTVELLVPTECVHVGETIDEAQLYNVTGGQLIEIVRFDREVISPVPKDEFVIGGDRLVYSGQIDAILELRNTHGLVNATHHVFSVDEMDKNRKLQMASVGALSPLVGNAMVDTDFEDENGVVLVAVAREGERLNDIPREIPLRPGDTLLLEGKKLKQEQFVNSLHFFDSVPLPQNGMSTMWSSLIMIGMVLLSALEIFPLLHSCFCAAMVMVLTKCLSLKQLQNSINWKVLMIFAGSVCLGRAIDETGLAQSIAHGVLFVSGSNALWSLVLMCATATFVTEFISNTTAAAVFTPIALHIAKALSVNPLTFAIALMLAISCSFATPIGSQSNTLIYGPGGYKFTDYLRIGICMNIILLIANIIIVNIVFPLNS